MNSTSQNPGRKLPFRPGYNVMDDRTIYVTLAVSTALGFLFIFLENYALQARNSFSGLSYGVFMSVLPALGALVVLKLTTFFVSWRGVAIVYVAFFVLVIMIHAVAR